MDLRNALLSKGSVKKEVITVPCDDGSVLSVEVHGLTAEARGRIMTTSMMKDEDGESVTDIAKMTPQLIIAGAFDPDSGEPIFSAIDAEILGTLSATFLDPIITAVTRLSGMSLAAAKEAEGNSAATTISASASPSPES